MSKKKHREKTTSNRNNMNNGMNMRNNSMNNPFGINPQQLLNMFGGNMDMNKLGNILSSMNREGFNINNQKEEFNNSNNENININLDEDNDDNMEFLLSLRKIVDSSKLDFIDEIIDLYEKGVLKK